MSIFEQFGTDAAKENDGVKVPAGTLNKDGTEPTFIVSRMSKSNKRYSKELDRVSKPYRRMIDSGQMPAATSEKLMLEVFCSTVLLGWENVQDTEGKQIPYSKEKAIEIMTKLPDLYLFLQTEANSAARFREEVKEDEAKN